MSKKNEIRLISVQGVSVMASIEYHIEEPHDSYYPLNILFFIHKGNLHLEIGGENFAFGPGKMVLLKRFTKGSLYKTFSPEEGYAQVYGIAFPDLLIKEVLSKVSVKKDDLVDEEDIPPIQEIIRENAFPEYTSFFEELFVYNEKKDEGAIQLQVKKALQEILEAHPGTFKLFQKYTLPVKVPLKDFMEYHFRMNLSIPELARLSGRSTSTFYRDFQEKFDCAPHQWILKRRLQEAHSILSKQEASVKEIYQEVGFKDLAHFSKAFKKEYGVPPSSLKMSIS